MRIPRLVLASALIALVFAGADLCWPAPRAEAVWTTDFEAAKASAAKSGKRLLLDFTGSDWCIYCQKLDAEVLSTPDFKAFAKDYVLVYVDFPKEKQLPEALKAQNDALREKFAIEGYPTVIVTDASGKEIRRAAGYDPGSGPSAYLAQFGPP